MTKGRLRLYLYAGKIAHFSFICEKGSKIDTLQPSGCNGLLVLVIDVVGHWVCHRYVHYGFGHKQGHHGLNLVVSPTNEGGKWPFDYHQQSSLIGKVHLLCSIKSSYFLPCLLWNPKISTPTLSECYGHCKGIPQAKSLHNFYLQSSVARNYTLPSSQPTTTR